MSRVSNSNEIGVRWRWRRCLWYLCCLLCVSSVEGKLTFRPLLHEPRVYETAPTGTYVLTFRAYDEFFVNNVSYQLLDGNDTFFLDKDTGHLWTSNRIGRSDGESYRLKVKASSGGQTEFMILNVVVTSKNKHSPRLRRGLNGSDTFYVDILPSTPVFTVVETVKARDNDIEAYNKEVYYFLSQPTKKYRDQFLTYGSPLNYSYLYVYENVTSWLQSDVYWEDEANGQIGGNYQRGPKERLLIINRTTGEIELCRALDENIAELTAKVIAVDGGSPPRWDVRNLLVKVKSIGAPFNVTVDNVTETSAKVCWKRSPIGRVDGFLVRYSVSGAEEDLNSNLTLNVTRGTASCVYLSGLRSAEDYELRVFGWNDEMVGTGSEVIRFNTLTPRCPPEYHCGNGTCHLVPSISTGSKFRSYHCECMLGFYGDNCEHFNPCASSPCGSNGTCTNISSSDYICHCQKHFTGDNCELFDPCITNPCGSNGVCAVFNFSYVCKCHPDYVGSDCSIYKPCFDCLNADRCTKSSNLNFDCECRPGYYGYACERFNPCAVESENKCQNFATCNNLTNNDYECHCPVGYKGKYCEVDIDDCFDGRCGNGGTCIDGVNVFLCKCPPRYTGPLCERRIDNLCDNIQCGNGAKCVEHNNNSFTCVCPTGFQGDLCDQKVVLGCELTSCQNQGSCDVENNQTVCYCPDEFQGKHCEFSGLCHELKEKTKRRGVFHFNATRGGNASYSYCPYGPLGVKVYRTCFNRNPLKSDAFWGPYDTSVCHTKFQLSPENRSVEMQKAKDVVQNTRSASHFGPRHVRNSTDAIERLLNSSVVDKEIAQSMFVGISNLMNANDSLFIDDDDLSDYGASHRLMRVIDKFIEEVDVDDTMNITTPNLMIRVHRVPRGQSGGSWDDMTFQGFSNVRNETMSEKTRKHVGATFDKITISAKVLKMAAGQLSDDVRLHYVAHRNAKLFRGHRNAAKLSLDRATFSARPVFTVSFSNFVVNDTNNSVSYTVKKPFAGKALCAYWVEEEFKWSTDGLTVVEDNDDQITCSSNHMTSFSILLDPNPDPCPDPNQKAQEIISYVGSSLSVLGLILTILTFSMFRCLNRERSGKILLNLCVSMLLLNVSFLTGAFKSDELKKNDDYTDPTSIDECRNVTTPTPNRDSLCTAVAVFTHYFLLTTLAWMTVEAINMYQLLIYVFATSETRFLLKRCFVAWGAPAVIVGVTAAVDHNYYNFSNEFCMLSPVNPYVYYLTLIGPCCLLLVVNIIVFIMVCRVLFQPRGGNIPQKSKPNSKWGPKDMVTFAQVRGAFTVMTLLGVTWVFGALAIGPARVVFQYVFCVCNSLQGFCVFIVRCLLYPEARSAWLLFFRTGTLKKHRGPRVATTNSSNNSQAKLTVSHVASTGTTSTTATSHGTNHLRARNNCITDTNSSLNQQASPHCNHSTKLIGNPCSSLNRNDEVGGEEESAFTYSSWVYGGDGKRIDSNITKANVDANDTKEGHFTNWEYITWQQKRDEDMAEDENKGFKSVWIVPETSPLRKAAFGAGEDAPFIEEQDDEDKGVDERDVALETVTKRSSNRGGTLTDQGYSSAEHSPTSKRDPLAES